MVVLTGATGFIGTRIARALRARDIAVRTPVRRPARASTLAGWGCEVVPCDSTDAAAVRDAVNGASVVVHLVSIIHGTRAEFDAVMVEGTRCLVEAAAASGCRRFVLMSALGTSAASRSAVPYYASKWEMEQAVTQADVAEVVFRPGFVFGRSGGSLPTFVRQVRLAPVTMVVGSGARRLQPIWVDDVASFVTESVESDQCPTGIFELAGPDVVTWNELYGAIAATLGKRRRRLHVPVGLMRAAASALEHLPNPPVTRDQLTMLELADNVCDPTRANAAFGITPIGLADMLERSLLGDSAA
ncbi:MAG: NAD(P)H-binding protein [Gaiellales bacterium]